MISVMRRTSSGTMTFLEVENRNCFAVFPFLLYEEAFVRFPVVCLLVVLAGGHLMKRGGSVVECRTRNRESPGSNPL